MRETETRKPWATPRATGTIHATVHLPGSKSLSARELLLGAIADTYSQIDGLLYARDTDLMVQGLQALGAEISPWPPVLNQPVRIQPISGLGVNPAKTDTTATVDDTHLNHPQSDSSRPDSGTLPQINCGLAGTVMRFLPTLAVVLRRPVRFSADPEANNRPLRPLLDALSALGATWESDNPDKGLFPFTIYPPVGEFPDTVVVDAEASSQFISALLLVAPLLGKTFTIHSKTAQVPSLPHIQMTLETLSLHGIDATGAPNPDGTWIWQVKPAAVFGQDFHIEPDLSNAGPFLAAAGIAGGQMAVAGWPRRSTQVGDRWRQILAQFGMKVDLRYGVLTARGQGMLQPVTLDCHDFGELVPTIAALAAYADGTSCLKELHHLRGHETDRLAALHKELNRLGIKCEITDQDGLEITGIPKERIPAQAQTPGKPLMMSAYGDHRMATFAALMGLYRPVQIDDIGATAKTFPDFPQLWKQVLGVAND